MFGSHRGRGGALVGGSRHMLLVMAAIVLAAMALAALSVPIAYRGGSAQCADALAAIDGAANARGTSGTDGGAASSGGPGLGVAGNTPVAKRRFSKDGMTISQFSKERKRANASQADAKLPGGRELEAAARARKAAMRDLSAKATGKTLRKIPASDKLSTFVIYGSHGKPELKASRVKAIRKAIRAIEGTGADCGMVFVDLHSGCGIAYNAGKTVYSASAFKAPFVFYMLQSAGKKGIGDGDRASAEAAILYSSNGAYDSLTFPRMGQDYIEWLEGYGIEYRANEPFYMFTSAKSMTRIWADLYQYLRSGSKDAKWFSGLLANTNRSYIRDGVAGKGVTVRNKAGWISGDYDASTDCAYIDVNGRPYLMSIMTSQPASQVAFGRVADLARQLFSARSALT